jgi:hypothetical protein
MTSSNSHTEFVAELSGEDMDEWRRIRDIRQRLEPTVVALIDKPINEWPTFQIQWDLTKEGQRYTLDGCSQESFEKQYPNGLQVRWITLNDLNRVLCDYNRRTIEETWEVGSKRSLANNIAWAGDRQPVTPIYIKQNSFFPEQIKLEGGNHRYAMVNAMQVTILPVLVEQEDIAIIEKIITLNTSPEGVDQCITSE